MKCKTTEIMINDSIHQHPHLSTHLFHWDEVKLCQTEEEKNHGYAKLKEEKKKRNSRSPKMYVLKFIGVNVC